MSRSPCWVSFVIFLLLYSWSELKCMYFLCLGYLMFCFGRSLWGFLVHFSEGRTKQDELIHALVLDPFSEQPPSFCCVFWSLGFLNMYLSLPLLIYIFGIYRSYKIIFKGWLLVFIFLKKLMFLLPLWVYPLALLVDIFFAVLQVGSSFLILSGGKIQCFFLIEACWSE